MRQSFTIRRALVDAGDQPRLLREIEDHTGSESEANSIVRSLTRLGSDASIDHYQVTPTPPRQLSAREDVAWNVRAVRMERFYPA